MNPKDIIQQQRELWNMFSPGWKKWDRFVMAWLQPIGEKLMEVVNLNSDDEALDIATGTGEPGLTAATKIKRVIGTDVSEGMIRIAQENAKTRGITNYKGQVTSASSLPFQESTFSVVLCRFGVMYFANPEEDLRNLVRVLKSGGRIAFSAWAESEKNPWATVSGKTVQELLNLPAPSSNMPGIFRYAKYGSLSSLFQQSGLKNIKEIEVKGELVFDSPEHYWEYTMDVIAPVAIALKKLDDSTREQIKQAVLKKAKDFENSGHIIFPWSAWVAFGENK